MEWQLAFLLILGSFLLLMSAGMPVAFAFVIVNLIGVIIWWGGEAGLQQLVQSMVSSVATFALFPVAFFILMGEVMFHSGIGFRMIDALDRLMGRLPGRLSLLAVGAGTLLASLSGSSLATTALMGSILVPEMEKRGYKKPMSLGPILGSGTLATMMPPSSLAVLLGAIGMISIGRILIGIIFPGLLMAILYAAYIIIRCWLQPSLAPSYEVSPIPMSRKLIEVVRHVLPVAIIIFLVTGVIFLGIASPSEAAATGTLGTVFLAAIYRRLSWEVMKKSFLGTLRVTGMMFMILAGAGAFSQILSFSGASRGFIEVVVGLPLAPILIIVAMQVVLLVLGMFMSITAIMMITLPMFVPVISTLGFDPVWFAVTFLLNMEIATLSPPYGLTLFAMKGVVGSHITMGDICRAALPFMGCDVVALALIIAFPSIALWLPSVMRG